MYFFFTKILRKFANHFKKAHLSNMPRKIKTKKGLNIPLKGKAEKIVCKEQKKNNTFAIKPTDFSSFTPKGLVKEGGKVKAGTAIFFDKYNPDIKVVSPVSGTLKAIERGERRKILSFVIEPDHKQEYHNFEVGENLNKEQTIELLLNSGAWTFIRQRPFDIIANPKETPKAIFISGFDSSPLAPDYDFILAGQEKDFQAGINALKKLTDGAIYLTTNGEYPANKIFANTKGVELNSIKGPHPAGNVGVQMHHINPISKGEVAWHINPQDVLIIGRLFNKGIFDASRIIALTGSEIKEPMYHKTILGANIEPLINNNVSDKKLRYISGNVLTGTTINQNGHIGYYDHQITVIPEGDDYEFFGWASPGFNKFSVSHTFFSWLTPKKEYTINANIHGGRRPFTFSEQYEKVLPMDILPVHLIKAIIVKDIDQMEQLGIYEVGKEDLALCEFVCTSKIEVQKILNEGFELMIKETK